MTTPATIPDPAIASLATALAEAELAAEKATVSHREAKAARDKVQSLIQTKDAARREIGTRRAAGDLRDDDRGDLAVLATDVETLGVILARQDTAVAEARAVAEAKGRDLEQARHNLDRSEMEWFAAALTPRIAELADLLQQALGEANHVAKRLGRGQVAWMPPAALMSALIPLDATRRW